MLKRAKIEYYNSRFNRIRNNTRENWRVINDLIGKKTTHRHIDEIENVNGEKLSNPFLISEEFCSYFSSIAQNLSESIP